MKMKLYGTVVLGWETPVRRQKVSGILTGTSLQLFTLQKTSCCQQIKILVLHRVYHIIFQGLSLYFVCVHMCVKMNCSGTPLMLCVYVHKHVDTRV